MSTSVHIGHLVLRSNKYTQRPFLCPCIDSLSMNGHPYHRQLLWVWPSFMPPCSGTTFCNPTMCGGVAVIKEQEPPASVQCCRQQRQLHADLSTTVGVGGAGLQRPGCPVPAKLGLTALVTINCGGTHAQTVLYLWKAPLARLGTDLRPAFS